MMPNREKKTRAVACHWTKMLIPTIGRSGQTAYARVIFFMGCMSYQPLFKTEAVDNERYPAQETENEGITE